MLLGSDRMAPLDASMPFAGDSIVEEDMNSGLPALWTAAGINAVLRPKDGAKALAEPERKIAVSTALLLYFILMGVSILDKKCLETVVLSCSSLEIMSER